MREVVKYRKVFFLRRAFKRGASHMSNPCTSQSGCRIISCIPAISSTGIWPIKRQLRSMVCALRDRSQWNGFDSVSGNTFPKSFYAWQLRYPGMPASSPDSRRRTKTNAKEIVLEKYDFDFVCLKCLIFIILSAGQSVSQLIHKAVRTSDGMVNSIPVPAHR